MISLKREAELRHALAHLYYAIEALAKGAKGEAIYELKSVEGLIFWDDDDDMTRSTQWLVKSAVRKRTAKARSKGKPRRKAGPTP